MVDAVSMSLLKGSVIDFATELIGSSFKVVENPQVSALFAVSTMVPINIPHRRKEVDAAAALAGNSSYNAYTN